MKKFIIGIILVVALLSGCTEVHTTYEAEYIIDYNPYLDYKKVTLLLQKIPEVGKIDFYEDYYEKDFYNETLKNSSYTIVGEIKIKKSSITFYLSIGTVYDKNRDFDYRFGYSEFEKHTTTRVDLSYSGEDEDHNEDLKATARWFKEIIEEEFNQTPVNEIFSDLTWETS